MNKKSRMILIGAVLTAFLFASCFPGSGAITPDEPAGFFTGIWHGWIAPISLIGSIFNDELSVYEPNNIGFWYEFGYYMAIVSGFGGLSLARGRKKKHHHDEDDDD